MAPLPGAQIFRKSALERLSTPEQLDTLVQVTTPKTWVALLAIVAVLAGVLLWSILGRIPTTISGKMILMPPEGVDEVYSTGDGFVSDILVKEGDHVKPGEVVAHVFEESQAVKSRGSRQELETRLAGLRQKIPFLEKQAKAKKEAAAMGLIPAADAASAADAVNTAKADLESVQTQLAVGTVQQKHATEVRALKAGRVVEVVTSPSTMIRTGAPVLTIMDDDEPLMALAFIPNVGDQAKVGMDAQVSPASFPKQEYGFIKGKVAFGSELPVRANMLYELTRSQSLDDQLTKDGPPFLVKIALERDPNSPSGFKWSASEGPEIPVAAGMMGEARVIVDRRRPIELALPALKSYLGL